MNEHNLRSLFPNCSADTIRRNAGLPAGDSGAAAKLERTKSGAGNTCATDLDTLEVGMHGNSKPPTVVACQKCGKSFQVSPPSAGNRRKYCSTECAYKSPDRIKHIKKKDRGSRTCGNCGEEFVVHTSAPEAKFCSQKCAASCIGKVTMAKNRRVMPRLHEETIACKTCGAEFKSQRSSRRKYCSGACSSSDHGSYKKRVATLRANGGSSKTHSRAASQWVELGGKRFFARSSWEANYARFLEWEKERGLIAEWDHEPHTFWFKGIKRGVLSYLPDFRVTGNDGRIEWHEVKGWMDARSKTKIKRMAKYHPKEVLLVIGSSWFKEANRKLSGIIPGWVKKGKPSLKSSSLPPREPDLADSPFA